MSGILDIEVYFPSTYIEQEVLEERDLCHGKYTKGLGQKSMAVVADNEDIYSFLLTVADRMIKKHNLTADHIGRVEVGTESSIDKSKSVKTLIMDLFGEGPHDMEGVTNVNACYGVLLLYLIA
jgi:hydroxymethylglutaryl-CoA synthase